MDAESIAKDFIGLQKQSFNNAIDTMILFQDQAERVNRLLANQMGIGEKEQKFVEQSYQHGGLFRRPRTNKTY